MTTYQKILLGGLGAMTPLLLNLLNVDLQNSLKSLTIIVLIGYFIKALLLFGIGALVIFLHSDETNKVKIFELGIAAPALIMLYINGNSIKETAQEKVSYSWVTSCYAGNNIEIQQYKTPEESIGDQLMRGLLGTPKKDKQWFIIAYQGDSINTFKEFPKYPESKVFSINKEYYIVLGAYLDADSAEKLFAESILKYGKTVTMIKFEK